MKYYYGNSYKEALSNPPANIKSDKTLKQYIDNYDFVIPETALLPDIVEVEVDSCLADNIEDTDWMEEYLNDYLSDKYGFCIEYYTWEVKGDKIVITNISWDTDE